MAEATAAALAATAAIHATETDLERSTSMVTELGERDGYEVISRHNALLREKFREHRGREAKRIGLPVVDLDPEVDLLLQELNLLYSEMGQRAITDFDEWDNHDNEITNILEGDGLQMFYQVEKDWHYRKEERRWTSMNDVSSWFRCRMREGKMVKDKLHIR